MRILVACEFSEVVKEQFLLRGHDAHSCDFLPGDKGLPNHHQCDVREILNDGWGLMIAHPPCTYLTYAGTRHWNNKDRYKLRLEAINLFMVFVEAPIKRICIENPLGIMTQVYRPPDQTIHPYYFGEAEMKRTCLWLKNLPKLVYQLHDDMFATATAAKKPEPLSIDSTSGHHKRYFTDSKIRDPSIRSKTFQSIAEAMAEQWG